MNATSPTREPVCWCGCRGLQPYCADYRACTDCGTLVSCGGLTAEEIVVRDDEHDTTGILRSVSVLPVLVNTELQDGAIECISGPWSAEDRALIRAEAARRLSEGEHTPALQVRLVVRRVAVLHDEQRLIAELARAGRGEQPKKDPKRRCSPHSKRPRRPPPGGPQPRGHPQRGSPR